MGSLQSNEKHTDIITQNHNEVTLYQAGDQTLLQ